MPDAVPEQLAPQQRGVIPARMPRPEHPGRERAGHPGPLRCPATVTLCRTTALATSAPAFPARPAAGSVNAVAVGELPDRTPVIVSGADDGTVRVWRLADAAPAAPPLDLSKQVRSVTAHGDFIITAAGADIAVHQVTLPRMPSSRR
jgi:hypothetical protein